MTLGGDDADLRALLEWLDPLTRDALRRVLIRDQGDRDAVSSWLLRYRDGHGDDWADIIDMLTIHPKERRRASCPPCRRARVRIRGHPGRTGPSCPTRDAPRCAQGPKTLDASERKGEFVSRSGC